MTGAPFTFGSFDGPCTAAALVSCPLLGKDGVGYAPTCFARNYELQASHFLVFQPAALALRIFVLVISIVMAVHVQSKYTAVGRSEFATFLHCFIINVFFEALLDSNIIPIVSPSYQYFAALSSGLNVATFWSLLISGLVPLQWIEEGSALSVWSTRISTLVVAVLTALITYATFHSALFFSRENPIFLFVISFILPLLACVVYLAVQVYVVLNRLSTYWPLGDLALATFFFLLGQTFTFFLSEAICESTRHYIDGNFFGTLCLGLSVMMIYKYWDTITEDEDEEAVMARLDDWHVDEADLAWEVPYAMEKAPMLYPPYPTGGYCPPSVPSGYA